VIDAPGGAGAVCTGATGEYFPEEHSAMALQLVGAGFGRAGAMSRQLIWQRSHRGTMTNRAAAIAHYQQHIEDVTAAVPPPRLLVYSADQGWEPLCAFLGLPVPATPFPKVNERPTIQRVIRGMTRGAYGILLALDAMAGAAIYGLWRLLS
jgi:hypothetical protein